MQEAEDANVVNKQRPILADERRAGQIDSADRILQAVQTEYVLWCEDDWLFTEPVDEWLPRRFDILDNWSNVFTVSLRHDKYSGLPPWEALS